MFWQMMYELFLLGVIFLRVYICNASNEAPKLQTYKSCEKAYDNHFLPRNCPVGYDRSLIDHFCNVTIHVFLISLCWNHCLIFRIIITILQKKKELKDVIVEWVELLHIGLVAEMQGNYLTENEKTLLPHWFFIRIFHFFL